jgi:hypothetical protein
MIRILPFKNRLTVKTITVACAADSSYNVYLCNPTEAKGSNSSGTYKLILKQNFED